MRLRRVNEERLLAAIGGAGDLDLMHCLLSRPERPLKIGPRTVDTHVCWYVVRGQMRGRVSGRPVVIEPGVFHWLSPGVSDRFESIGEPGLQVYSMRFAVREAGHGLRLKADHRLVRAAPRLHELYHRLALCHRQGGPLSGPRFRALLVLLLTEALGALRAEAAGAAALGPQQVAALHNFFDARAADAIGPADLAQVLHLSHDYFTRKFKAHFGQPPRRWLREQRLRLAGQWLLESQLSVKEVAARVGYGDQRFFARDFRRYHGLTPSAYRRQRGL